MKDVDPAVRGHSIAALAAIRAQPRIGWSADAEQEFCRTVNEAITAAMGDSTYNVRGAAIDALNPTHATSKLVDVLVSALGDPNLSSNAAAKLATFQPVEDLDPAPLLVFLRSRTLCEHAATACGGLRPMAIAPVLFSWLRGRDKALRYSAALALGRMQIREAIPELLKMANSRTGYGVAAVRVLGSIRDPCVTAALRQLLGDPDEVIRQEVVRALGNIGDMDARKALLVSLRDSSRYVRMMAKETLERLEIKQ
jgi:HEAT repeat protein